MQLLLRRPFHRADAREELVPWPLLLFIMMVSGFVTYELSTEWPAAKAVFLWAPQQVDSALGLATANGWVQGVWTLFVFPALLWLPLGAMILVSGAAKTLSEAWRRLALPLVVVIAAGHMGKGVAKFTSWGGYLPGALHDPLGASTAVKLSAGSTPTPAVLLAMPWVSAISVALLALATLIAVREARLANPAKAGRLAMPILLVAVCFGLVTLGWGLVA